MDFKKPDTAPSQIEQNIAELETYERDLRAAHNLADRCIARVADFCGSRHFVAYQLLFCLFWIMVNRTGWVPHGVTPDRPPYPALATVLALEAILLSNFILMAERSEQALAVQREKLDLHINLLAEQENSEMLRILSLICKKLNIEVDHETIEELANPTNVVSIAEKISELEAAEEPED